MTLLRVVKVNSFDDLNICKSLSTNEWLFYCKDKVTVINLSEEGWRTGGSKHPVSFYKKLAYFKTAVGSLSGGRVMYYRMRIGINRKGRRGRLITLWRPQSILVYYFSLLHSESFVMNPTLSSTEKTWHFEENLV